MSKRENDVTFALLCKELLTGASIQDLVRVTQMHIVTVRKKIHAMRQEAVLVVIDWANSAQGKPVCAVYRFRQHPDEQDEPCPV